MLSRAPPAACTGCLRCTRPPPSPRKLTWCGQSALAGAAGGRLADAYTLPQVQFVDALNVAQSFQRVRFEASVPVTNCHPACARDCRFCATACFRDPALTLQVAADVRVFVLTAGAQFHALPSVNVSLVPEPQRCLAPVQRACRSHH
jgi:hypothetical protein